MRRLLVKLVAIETAFVGWLAYWLFLVYANNPAVASELAGNLQRFPQLSFSTVDIAILVIIAGLAIGLAFKFQRGLRPGIRLERALQMLENLMKRNLVLEAQVAELKIEKTHVGPPPVATPTITSIAEPRSGSWEKAFRTPLEAGPPLTTRASTQNYPEATFEHENAPAPRIEAKQSLPPQSHPHSGFSPRPPTIIAEKPGDKATSASAAAQDKTFEKPISSNSSSPLTASSWEDSPKYVGESRGILTPSAQPRRVPAISESGGLRQPYIPAPAPKAIPSSVIVGPMSSSPPSQPRPTLRSPALALASPKSSISGPTSRPVLNAPKPPAVTLLPRKPPILSEPTGPLSANTTVTKPTAPTPTESTSPFPPKPAPEATTADYERAETKPVEQKAVEADDKSAVKPSPPVKKKFPYEED